MSDDARKSEQIVTDLMKKFRICMATTVGVEGQLLSRPMARQNSEFDGTIRLLAPRNYGIVPEIEADPRVNVSVQSSEGFVSVAGNAVVDDEREIVASNWSYADDAWFPGGQEQATSILVRANSAEYWDAGGSTVAHIPSFTRSAISLDHRTPDVGSSGTVEL
ncbi:pyridoxamine 5'-phosphate oxidase family protein [Dietzia sp.]|uniref:pyridoxamine 5'-phosphate oxidase family protein n=1 Tax=Dietzia sp. TaxID=1871616 RepID=UPI002FDA9BCA